VSRNFVAGAVQVVVSPEHVDPTDLVAVDDRVDRRRIEELEHFALSDSQLFGEEVGRGAGMLSPALLDDLDLRPGVRCIVKGRHQRERSLLMTWSAGISFPALA
jgi:hypothetical protein